MLNNDTETVIICVCMYVNYVFNKMITFVRRSSYDVQLSMIITFLFTCICEFRFFFRKRFLIFFGQWNVDAGRNLGPSVLG